MRLPGALRGFSFLLLGGCLVIASWLLRRTSAVAPDVRTVPPTSAPAPPPVTPPRSAKQVPCADSLAEPLPPCLLFDEQREPDLPLLRPQIDGAGAIQLALPAYRYAAADELVRRAIGEPRGDEFAFVEVLPRSERLVHAGRCPGDGFLAAFTRDDRRTLHLLCLEYDTASHDALPPDKCLDNESCCAGPLAWHGVVADPARANWSRTRRLQDRCESDLRDEIVLALLGPMPAVVYCTPAASSCTWRFGVLSESIPLRSFRSGSTSLVEPEPREFFVASEVLSMVVWTPDPEEKFEAVYERWTLDRKGTLRTQPLDLESPRPAPANAHPRAGFGRSPRPVTSFASDPAGRLTTALPFAPLEALPAEYAPLERVLAVSGTAPAGARTYGTALRIFPAGDGESQSLRVDFPRGGSLSLEGRTLQWARASCSDACVTAFRLLPDEVSATERYSGGFYLLRTPAQGAKALLGDVTSSVHCVTLANGDLSCDENK